MKVLIQNIPILLIILGFIQSPYGQNFAFEGIDPFGLDLSNLPSNTLPNQIEFHDFDQDGDLDLFMYSFEGSNLGDTISIFDFGYVTQYFENIGDESNPAFAPPQQVFQDLELPDGFFFPSIGDLNGDSNPDMLAMSDIDTFGDEQHLRLYLGSGQTIADPFITMPADTYNFSTLFPYSWLFPELVDLDEDGDLDFFMSGTVYSVNQTDSNANVCIMARNNGTINAPKFTSWFINAFNSKQDTSVERMSTADINNDGYMDIFSIRSGTDAVQIAYRENIAQGNQAMDFDDPVIEPFGLPSPAAEDNYLALDLVDIDGDADLDLFVLVLHDDDGIQIQYFENALCETLSESIDISICEGDTIQIGDEVFHDTGMFVIDLQRSNGCDSVLMLDLDVLPISDTLINIDLCEGDSISIADQTISTSGSYFIAATNANGCDSIIQAEVTLIYINDSVQVEGPTLIAAGGFASYQWVDCTTGHDIDGEIQESFTPAASGFYSVILENEFGCLAQSDCIEYIVSSTHEPGWASQIRIFPNPATVKLYVKNINQVPISKIEIFAADGKLVEFFNDAFQNGLSVEDCEPGIHLINIWSGDSFITRKIIITGD